jgi:hypothetical protein
MNGNPRKGLRAYTAYATSPRYKNYTTKHFWININKMKTNFLFLIINLYQNHWSDYSELRL